MVKAKILSTLLITLGLLFASGQALAQNPPPPQCGAGSINYNGDVDIVPPNGSNDCIIAGDVTATGYIRINAPLGKIQITGNITASNHGNVILSAGSTVQVGGSIVVNNASAPLGQSGSVDIKANMTQAGAPFVIGSASSNGVAGTINCDTTLGGGNNPSFIRGGIRIRNRNDITLTSMSALSVKGSASRSGVIILEAVDGTLSLPTGTLSSDGQTGQSAGAVVLQAHAITTQNATTISASDSVGQASHFVNVAAGSISYQGATGLTIRANGGGSTANGTGSFVYALPEFGIFVTDDSTTNPQNFTWTVTYPFGTDYPGALSWNGAAGSSLTVTANGQSHTQVLMTGYPLTFGSGAGDVLLAARGNEDHRIDLIYTGSTSGINGLVFASNKVTLNASANAGSGQGGAIFVSMPKTVSTSPQQVLFTADGPSSAAGNGGSVQFFPKGDIAIGSNAGQIHLSAQSGNSGGNGGTAIVSNKPFTTELASSTGAQVTARGTNGDGGQLELHSLFANFNGTGLKLAADAVGSGKGGQVVLDVDGPITVGSGFGAVKLSAEADATIGGDGGKVTVISGSSASITSGQLSVKSGPTGSGGQLDLNIGGSLSLTGSLKADAGSAGNGHGGSVTVNAGDIVLNGSSSGGGQALSADGAGQGAGGNVSLLLQASSQPTTIASQTLGALSLSANGGKDGTGAFAGAGGVIQLTDLNEGFLLTGGALDVKSGPGKNAGSILVDAGTTLAISGDIKAVGTGNGANGGTIRLTAQSDNDIVFSGTGPTNIIADGGQNGTTGNGGQITISNSGIGSLVFQNQVILSAAAEGSNGGTAGTVWLSTGGQLVLSGSGNRVKANGNGVPSIDNIHLETAGNLSTGSGTGQLDLVARGNGAGNRGGVINIVTSGAVTANGANIDVTAGSQAAGGSILVHGTSITVTGELNASGKGHGGGGRIALEASGSLVLSSATIRANGGISGVGGTIDLTYKSENDLAINTLSATGSSSGGAISIRNTQNADMTLNVAGTIDTSSAASTDPGGALLLSVVDDQTNGITLNANGTDFNSVLSAQGKFIMVVSATPLTLGIAEVQATNGNIFICAGGGGGCAVAAVSTIQQLQPLQQGNSIIGIEGSLRAPNGGVVLTGNRIYSTNSPGVDKIVILPGNDQPVSISCNELIFGENRYIYGTQFANGNVSVTSLGNGLTITMPDGKTAGFKSANKILLSSGPGMTEALSILNSNGGSAHETIFSLESSETATLLSNGPLLVNGVKLGNFDSNTGTVDTFVSPWELHITSISSTVDLHNTIAAVSTVRINTQDGSNGDIAVNTIVAGSSTAPGEIEIASKHDLGLFGQVVQTPGAITLRADGIILVYENAKVKTLSSGGFQPEKITIQSMTAIGFLVGAEITAKDEIIISTSATLSKTNPDPAGRPATVDASQVSITPPASIYWGDATKLNVSVQPIRPVFSANGKDLTFDGNLGTINIASATVFKSGN